MPKQSVLLICLMFGAIWAQQTAPPDTAQTVPAVISAVSRSSEYDEQVLQTINIEAIIEKPSVTFVPKRAETAVGTLPLERRSFLNEMRQKPETVLDYGQELEGGKRIKKLKKLLAKEDK
ncbi:MAG TPA: hypothetical protein PKN04_03155 [bacterium]|nr:hypothetical protein [bacterium]HNT64754.1 hypothetical protein [bacterium]HOX85915.1 hypothetical protein [bacterium]HPG45102.1 hypothetical protein [bacterium]HPM97344.1 hypothetical protein [bacterium]